MASLTLRRLSKTFDARTKPALQELSLDVRDGEFLVLLGPSGCGKTTTLKMVNRLIEPSSGQIIIDGVDAATREVTELRRSIGYVIQQVGLFPHQTIADNVGTVPRLLNWPKARWRTRADELLQLTRRIATHSVTAGRPCGRRHLRRCGP